MQKTCPRLFSVPGGVECPAAKFVMGFVYVTAAVLWKIIELFTQAELPLCLLKHAGGSLKGTKGCLCLLISAIIFYPFL